MAGSIHLKQGGVWEQIHQMFLKDVGVWKDPAGVWVKKGGRWYLVYPPVALDLNFTKMTEMDPRVTFSRKVSGAAMYFDKDGLLKFNKHNFISESERFTPVVPWFTGSGAVMTANAGIAPNGQNVATKFEHATAGTVNGGSIYFDTPLIYAPRGFMSMYAKAGTKSYLSMALTLSGGGGPCWFNLLTGTPGFFDPAYWTATGMQDVGDGWYRCWGLFKAAASFFSPFYRVCEADATITCTTTGTIFIWGAMAEFSTDATAPSPYIKTVGAAYGAPRFDYEPLPRTPKGLLIETPLISEQSNSWALNKFFWNLAGASLAIDSTFSPSGAKDAELVIASAADARVYHYDQFNSPDNGVYSIFVKRYNSDWCYIRLSDGASYKMWVNLVDGTLNNIDPLIVESRIQACGNGWFRIFGRRVGSTDAEQLGVGPCDAVGSTVVTPGKGVYVWGAQFEVNAPPFYWFHTHYPTGDQYSCGTRAPDDAIMVGANFSDWYDHNGGTFIIDFDLFQVNGTRPLIQLDDSTANEQIQVYVLDGVCRLTVISGGVIQANFSFGGITPNTPHKVGLSYKLNDYAACIDGGPVFIDAAGTVPTPTQMYLGRGLGANYLQGHLGRVQFYHRSMSDSALQNLTTLPTQLIVNKPSWQGDALTGSPRWNVSFIGALDGDMLTLDVDDDPLFRSLHDFEETGIGPFQVADGHVNNMGATIAPLSTDMTTWYARAKITRRGVATYSDSVSMFLTVLTASWNPSDLSPGTTLSNNNRRALVASGTAFRGVRATTSKLAGKYHVEFMRLGPQSSNWGFGIANAAQTLTTAYMGGTGNNSIALCSTGGGIYKNAANQGACGLTPQTGVWHAMEVDMDGRTFKFWTGTAWGPSFDFTSINAGPYFIAWSSDTIGNDCSINTGQEPWSITPSAGFGRWL